MSTVVPLRTAARRAPRLALLGTGVVGSALVARYQRLQARDVPLPTLAWLANSRALHDCAGAPQRALQAANRADARADDLPPWAEAEALHAGDIVIDATASDAVAGWHAEWLSRGVHVVTANKLGAGSALSRAQSIEHAGVTSGARYGEAATVGAGLPLLRSLRALVAGGDRIHRVEGVLSGSLAWLFNQYDGMRPFSGFVRQARQAGYTEPDPRIDLSGEDVRRKLLILARAAGLPLEQADVRVESLVPAELSALPWTASMARLVSWMRRWRRVSRMRTATVAGCASSGVSTRNAQASACRCCRPITRCAAAAAPTTGWRSTATATTSNRWWCKVPAPAPTSPPPRCSMTCWRSRRRADRPGIHHFSADNKAALKRAGASTCGEWPRSLNSTSVAPGMAAAVRLPSAG